MMGGLGIRSEADDNHLGLNVFAISDQWDVSITAGFLEYTSHLVRQTSFPIVHTLTMNVVSSQDLVVP